MKCIIIDDEPLAIRVLSHHIKQTEGLELIKSFENGYEALHFIQTKDIDLIFLDIQMPEINGLQFLKILKNPPQVIICSAYDQYALQAFDYEVTDYLLKPVSYPRFLQGISKALHIPNLLKPTIAPSKTSDDLPTYFYIKEKEGHIKLNYADIHLIEGLRNYCSLYTNEKKYLIGGHLGFIAKKLEGHPFVRIHKSYVVAIDKIDKFSPTQVVVRGRELPIGRSYRKTLMKYLDALSW